MKKIRMINTIRNSLALKTALVLAAVLIAFQGQAVGMVTGLAATDAYRLIAARGGDPQFAIIDMRTPAEFKQGHIAGAELIDYYSPDFKAELDRLDRGRTYLIYCRSGNRSGKALKMMADKGFDRVYHLDGGILDWRSQGLPLVQSH